MSNPELDKPSTVVDNSVNNGEIIVDDYDIPDIKQESPLPSSNDNILPEPEKLTTKILPDPVTMPTNDEPPASIKTETKPIISPSVSYSGFKPVRGRPKIMLCTRCKTFVSRDKLDKHSISKCDSIIKKREANKGGCGCGCRRRKRRVDPQFLKDFRSLKKENAATAAAGLAVAKKVAHLRKKLSKKKLKLLPKDVKNLFSFLEKKFTK